MKPLKRRRWVGHWIGFFVSCSVFGIQAPETWAETLAEIRVETKLPEPRIEKLANGLEVVWFRDDRLPVVNFILGTRTGARADAAGKAGTAELLQVMLDRGSAGLSAQEMALEFDQLGASHFASADEDSMAMGVHGLALDSAALLNLLAKQSLEPNFLKAGREQDQEFKREKARVLDRLTHLGDSGDTLSSYAFRKLIARGTPYARAGFMTIREFETIQRSDVQEAYFKHFTPANAILTVVGRVDEATLSAQIQKTFGAWRPTFARKSRRPHPEGTPSPSWARDTGDIVIVNRPGLNQSYVRVGFPTVTVGHPDHYGLMVANAILGETFNSRLNSLIRDQLGLTYGIGSGFSFYKDFGMFAVTSSTRADTVGKMLSETLRVMRDYAAKGPTDEEVTTAKEYLMGSFPLSVATTEAVAMRWLSLYIFGLPTSRLSGYLSSIEKVDAPAVRRALKAHFEMRLKDSSHPLIVVAGDAPIVAKSLKAAGFSSVRTLAADALLK